MKRTALIMAGGTGGHVFPALALARLLRTDGWRVVWLGTKQGMEARLVPQQGFVLETVAMGGLRGKGVWRILSAPWMVAVACLQSVAILLRQRPDVVVGFGGFASFPGGLSAALLKKPLVLHEQNAVAGLSNRVLARLARRVFEGFPGSFKAPSAHPLARMLGVPRDVRWVGNPVRPEIQELPPPAVRFAGRSGVLKILVLGGSQGASALNALIPRALALIPLQERPEVVHQGGARMMTALQEAYREHDVTGELRPFIDDMAAAYARCDLVICRAGALTVAELSAAGIGSLLVPYPHAVDDHQTANARFMEAHGAAYLMPQFRLDPEHLARWLREATREGLLAMAEAARALAKPQATSSVAAACREFAA
ncbi:MAG: undecaprenyldiphospho-muramoylpentapeptide beta-N-acetylglucosaminyltransferase [Betaproteobacteria bacterium]|nr:undecaprenyldiphospho-muramoylpentapeptide beta-N-acetylglucosaminyltransferase [Betaproteobacteria bacterium]MDE2624645.1 undecaprenyldiphospho-muramoylpentapeptide beta-N-acetylglucosaminyltransferase [Betaproteobacteria bacterium]